MDTEEQQEQPVTIFNTIPSWSPNYWNRYASWRENHFNHIPRLSYRMPEVCEICGEPGDTGHIAQKQGDGIYRCNGCATYFRPGSFWKRLFGYTLFDLPLHYTPIKDETNDVIW